MSETANKETVLAYVPIAAGAHATMPHNCGKWDCPPPPA